MVSSQISSTSVAFDYSEDLLDMVKKNGYATGLIGKNHPFGSRSNLTTIADTIIGREYTEMLIDNRMEPLIGS